MTDQEYYQQQRRDFYHHIAIMQSSGWKIVDQNEAILKMKKNTASTAGHILIAILIGWVTLFIPNIIYHLVSNKTQVLPKPQKPE